MQHHRAMDVPLREICFDFAAGMFDRSVFHQLVRNCLRQRMSCAEVLIRCKSPETAGLLERLKGVGWIAEVQGGRQQLHAAMAHNGRLIGLISCERDASAPAWTQAEGVALLRHATTMSSPTVCPPGDVQTEMQEGTQA